MMSWKGSLPMPSPSQLWTFEGPRCSTELSRMRVPGVTTWFSMAEAAVSIFITEPGSYGWDTMGSWTSA